MGEKSIMPVSGIILRMGFRNGSMMTDSACQMDATMLFDRLTTLKEINKLKMNWMITTVDRIVIK